MPSRRLIQLLLAFILILSPFGRIGPVAAHELAGHCAGAPAPHSGKAQQDAVDCTIACAAIAPAPASLELTPPAAAPTSHAVRPQSFHAGLHPGADPPPPKIA